MSTYNDGGPAFPLPDDTNFQYPGMTLRQYAAIRLRVPNSGDDWLDDLIREAQRNDFAAKAMQAGVDLSFTHHNYFEKRAEIAYRMADAMLAARGAA